MIHFFCPTLCGSFLANGITQMTQDDPHSDLVVDQAGFIPYGWQNVEWSPVGNDIWVFFMAETFHSVGQKKWITPSANNFCLLLIRYAFLGVIIVEHYDLIWFLALKTAKNYIGDI